MIPIIPKVNRIVMGRMVLILCENLLEDRIHSDVTGDRNTFPVELPTPTNQQCFCLQILGVF